MALLYRNPSNGSGFSDTGSMERPKIAPPPAAAGLPTVVSTGTVDKRKKSEESSRESRIDAQQVIDDLIKSANLEHGSDEGIDGYF